MNIPFPNKKYQIIYADPGWLYKNKRTGGSMKSGSANKYKVMKVEDICALDVPSICDDNCLLAMWHVGPQPEEALKVMKAWGFKLKTMKGFTWHKLTKHGKDHFGMGFLTRANTEDCLFAVKGKVERVSASVRQLIVAKVGRHSKKPPEARTRLVDLLGDIPRIELFARERFDGWDAWGNEIENN